MAIPKDSRPNIPANRQGLIISIAFLGFALCLLVGGAFLIILLIGAQAQVETTDPSGPVITATPRDQVRPMPEPSYLYQVQFGDDLQSIAALLETPVDSLAAVNGIISQTVLLPGQKLLVPGLPASIQAQPTPLPPAPPATVLVGNPNSETIRQKLSNSQNNWQTLWADFQMADYGPSAYIGSPRIYRAQVWLNPVGFESNGYEGDNNHGPPGQSLELFGLFSGDVASAHALAGGLHIDRSPQQKEAILSPSAAASTELLRNRRLRAMLLPSSAKWARQPGSFQVEGEEEIAGRMTIVVNWINLAGQREDRLWIDAATGLILRWQEFGAENYQTLMADTIVSAIALNQAMPANRVFTPGAVWRTEFYAGPQAEPLSPAPGEDGSVYALVLPYASRKAGPITPAPEGFQVADTPLHFLYPNQLEQAVKSKGSASIPVNLLANGYLIGQTEMGLPWGLRCERSPDGRRIAFTTGSDGVNNPDLSVRWFNLDNPEMVFQPMPAFTTEYFSFAPLGDKLAVFARHKETFTGGIYLIDLVSGEYKLLLEMEQANSLVWSPEGDYLAFIGQKAGEIKSAIYIVHIKLVEVIDVQIIDFSFYIPSNWSGQIWQHQLPQTPGGLERCASPPVK